VARRFTLLLVWLALTAEVEGEIFSGKWETPLTTIGTAIFKPLPGIKFPLWDIALLVTLFVALGAKGASKDRAKPVVKSAKVALLSILGLWVWGVIRGGDVRQTMWQLHSFVISVALAFAVAATCRTAKHIATLGKVVLFAAVYRAFVLIVFYFTIARGLNPPLQVMTTHADSALFVTGMLIVIANAIERRRLGSFMWMIGSCIPLALAIKWNNRRLAWLSLMIGLALFYYVLPRTRFKRRANWLMIAAVPLFAFYVVVGWGRTEGMFKPVGAISTMFGKHEDTSSEMRDIENYNLVQTLRSNPVLGTGWGHEYNEQSVAISIKEIFPQYRFIPHNSVLGLLAFSGVVGFGLCWQLFVVAAFFLAISIRESRSGPVRVAAILGLTTIATFIFQMWGDMGWNTLSSDVLMAVAIGAAMRVPVLSGAWPEKRPSDAGSDEERGEHPEDAIHAEGDEGLPKPPLGAPSLTRVNEGNDDRGAEDAEDDELAHG
jgi:hypothetical protein